MMTSWLGVRTAIKRSGLRAKNFLAPMNMTRGCNRGFWPQPAAATNSELIFENTVLMLEATLGMRAPAATATKPAISAYSIRSWPRLSFKILEHHKFDKKAFSQNYLLYLDNRSDGLINN
jgi:hypothetical protein